MSSDYLLGKLNFNADEAARRLGDGRYESRLISDAVLAKTGQRFLAGGLENDYEQFRYLMDNALASKNELNLAVGVSLTSAQVAALTHDIVWMEERIVDGQKVLVPVLYLAQAESRNVRGGSLIQGRDLELMAGNDLVNVGTLRATNNLSADVKGSLYQGGLIEAKERLSLMATDSIRNALAGEIRGNQVSLTTLKGDIVNDRTAIAVGDGSGMLTLMDDGANISARGALSIKSGRDLINSSTISSGGDASLSATRDLNLLATRNESEHHESFNGGHRSTITTTVENLASSVKSGGNLSLNAGRDINVIASTAEAKGNLSANAERGLTLAAAGDEHSLETRTKDGKKRIHEEDSHTVQKAAEFRAGDNVITRSGGDTTLVASKISAGNEAFVYAGNDLNLLAAQNRDYTLYDMKEKGGFGAKKMQRDEVTQVTHVGSEIKTGGNLTLVSEGDQRYQVAKLESGKDITLDSGGAIVFEGVKDSHDESHTKSDGDAFWTSSKGRGNNDETLRQSHLIASGKLTIKAVDGLKIDIKHVDQQSVHQAIDAMVEADPQLAWLKQAEARGDIDWRQVKEIHESFKYQNSGLGPASQLIIAIVMAAVIGPMSSMILQSVAVTAATKAAVSTIDNRGNLGKVAKDVTSKEALKSYVVAAATAGVTQGLNYDPGAVGLNPESLKTVALKVSSDALIKTAVYGGSLKDNFASSAVGTAAAIGGAYGAGKIGDLSLNDGNIGKILLHAGLGGLLAEATGGDFRTGAIAGGANEVLIGLLGERLLPKNLVKGSAEYAQAQANLLALSQVVGVLGAAASDGDLGAAATVAANATQYNFLGKHDKAERDHAREEFKDTGAIDPAKRLVRLEGADHRSDDLLAKFRLDRNSLTPQERTELAAYLQVYAAQEMENSTVAEVNARVRKLISDGPENPELYRYAGTTEAKNAFADAQRAMAGGWFDQLVWTRTKTENELIFRDAQSYLRINNELQGLSNIGNPALYGLTGPLGTSIRIAAAVDGVFQIGFGTKQAINGDIWNAAGNIVVGALGVAGAGLPNVRGPKVAVTGELSVTNPKPGKQIAEVVRPEVPKNANATSMLTDSETAALVERNVIGGTAKGAAPKVAAEGAVGGRTFQDVNQTSRPLNEADPKIPSLITDRIAGKTATNSGKLYPNGNMKDAHAEIGVIQQAYSAGKTAGADMSMTVTGKDVCGFCKGDIAAAAERAELKSLTVSAIDDDTGLPKNYYWEPGMKSIKEKK